MTLKDCLFGLALLYFAGTIASLLAGSSLAWGHVGFAAGAALVGVPLVVAHLHARDLGVAAWCRRSSPTLGLVLLSAAPLMWQAVVLSVADWTRSSGSVPVGADAQALAQSAVVVVLLPLAEEMAFRVLLLGQFLAWGWSPLAAAAAQAVLFGLSHSTAGPYAATLIGFCGLAYALITIRAGMVWPAMVLHVGWNTIELAVHVLSGHAPQDGSSADIPPEDLLAHAVAVAGLMACSLWFWRRGQSGSAAPFRTRASTPLTPRG